MELSRSLLKDFASVTKDDEQRKTPNIIRGTVSVVGDNKYVNLDGSEVQTPISEVIDVREGDRVLVSIENHTATIIGNLSNPPSAHRELEAFKMINSTNKDLTSKISDVGKQTDSKLSDLGRQTDSKLSDINRLTDTKISDFGKTTNSRFSDINREIVSTKENVNSSLNNFGKQITNVESNTNTKISGLNNQITRVADQANSKIGDLNTKITDVSKTTTTKLGEYDSKITSATNRVNDLNNQVSNTNVRVGQLNTQVTATNGRISQLDTKITNTVELTDKKINDFGNQINSNQKLNDEQLKALADQMLITKQELDAKASLATIQEWKAAYDKFVAANEQEQKLAERDLVSLTNRVQVVQANLGNMSAVWNTIDKVMRFGNEGLSIGQASSDSQILISDNRISMFSAGQEVMYISQGVIHIDNGVFTKSLRIGNYVETQYETNEKINVIRYVGP